MVAETLLLIDEAVLQYHQISELARPRTRDLGALQDWLRRPTLGGVYLTGRDRNIWADGTDLMLLAKQTSSNRFTRWISDCLAPKYYQAMTMIRDRFAVCDWMRHKSPAKSLD